MDEYEYLLADKAYGIIDQHLITLFKLPWACEVANKEFNKQHATEQVRIEHVFSCITFYHSDRSEDSNWLAETLPADNLADKGATTGISIQEMQQINEAAVALKRAGNVCREALNNNINIC